MKEANELLEIWKIYHETSGDWHLYTLNQEDILLFWTLKAKIDDYKKQIINACAEVDKLTRIINKIEAIK